MREKRLTEEDVELIKKYHKEGNTEQEIAVVFRVTTGTICRIILGDGIRSVEREDTRN